MAAPGGAGQKRAAVGGAAGDQNKAGAGPEGLDWEPPGGLGKAGCVSRPAGGAPNPFSYAVWLGKVGTAEPEGELTMDQLEQNGRAKRPQFDLTPCGLAAEVVG